MKRYWFISTKYRRKSTLVLTTCVLAFMVIMLGAYTRLTDAGLSCPDWPNCYGYLTAPLTPAQIANAIQNYPLNPVNTKKAWTEMTHRYFAGFEGLLILAFAFSILFSRKAKTPKSTLISIGLIGLLILQVTLGMLTVTEKLKPMIVLAHLLTGLSLLSLLWWAYLDLPLRDNTFIEINPSRASPWLWLGFFLVVGQISLGGWVSSHYAGLACIDLPYCNGTLFPTLHWNNLNTDLITIHMLHRIGAMVTGTYLFIMALFLMTKKTLRSGAWVVLSLVMLQIGLGILNVIWLRPVWTAMLHHGVAILLLMSLITLLVKNFYFKDNRYDQWLT